MKTSKIGEQYLLDKGFTQEEINAMTLVEIIELKNKLIKLDKRRDEDER